MIEAMTSFTLRTAIPEDAAALTALMLATWETAVETTAIASVLTLSNHSSHIIYQDETPAGFVDGFLTVSASGVPRWEVDLLAVHPAYRGQGFAPMLINASLEAGLEQGAEQARALVYVGNHPAEQSFTRCGFQPDTYTSQLYVFNNAERFTGSPGSTSAHFHPVQTFSYTGLWIEDHFARENLSSAKTIITRYGWSIAGAVIPSTQPATMMTAQSEGYSLVGDYRNWQRNLK